MREQKQYHSWQPKKWDEEHEWNCTVCGEGNPHDRARCRGCKAHVGNLWQEAAEDTGKNSSGKGKRASLNQEAVIGTQHAKMQAEAQEKLQAVEKTIAAMGDNEQTTECRKLKDEKTFSIDGSTSFRSKIVLGFHL